MTLQLYAGGPADSDDHGCTIGDVSEKFPRPRADRNRRAVVLVGDTGIEPVTSTVSILIMFVALRVRRRLAGGTRCASDWLP